MEDKKAKPDLRIKCAEIVLDRTYGKATQPIETNATGPVIPTALFALTPDQLIALINQKEQPAQIEESPAIDIDTDS